jgi:hypothetical protein
MSAHNDPIVWDEWKYRHELFSRMQFRYAGGVAVICSLPFFRPESICDHGVSFGIFAALALALGVFGFIHLILEYVRVVQLRTQLAIFPDKSENTHFKKNHPVYFFLRYHVPFDAVMWFLIATIILVSPVLLYCFGRNLISCTIA